MPVTPADRYTKRFFTTAITLVLLYLLICATYVISRAYEQSAREEQIAALTLSVNKDEINPLDVADFIDESVLGKNAVAVDAFDV